MNVVELYTLTKWVVRELIESKLLDKYSNLQAILQQNADQSSVAFEEPKNDLIESIGKVDLTTLTKDQVAFLDQIGILQAIGRKSEQQIEDILFRHRLDIITVVEKFQIIIDNLNNGIGKMNFLREGLEGCIQDDIDEYGDDIIIRVSFLDDASISDVTKFKDWGAKWHNIGRGIAIAHNKAPEDIKIVGASKGSVILDFATIYVIAKTLSSIIREALVLYEKVLEIKKKSSEIKHINLKNDVLKQTSTILKKASEAEEEAGIKEILDTHVKKLKLKKTVDGDKITELNKSITDVVNFVRKGGEVDFVIPEQIAPDSDEENPPEDKFAEIRESAKEIRILDNKLKLIEHTQNEDEEFTENEDEEFTENEEDADENEPQE